MKKPIALLAVGSRSKPVHPLIVDRMRGFAGEIEIAQGHIDLRDLPYRSWLSDRVAEHHKFMAIANGGIALFVEGQLAAFHTGMRDFREDFLADLAIHAAHAFAGTEDEEVAKRVAAAFMPAVCLFVLTKKAATSAKTFDPHAVLGVPVTATRAQVDAAWRTVRAENHPDRLAGMSKRLRAVAEEQSKEANLARDEIYRRNGW